MKKFSEEDKVLIKKLNEFYGDIPRSLCDFLSEEFFTDCALFFRENQERPAFYMEKDIFDNPIDHKRKMQSFWNMLSLIQYLIDENYITIIPYTNQNKSDDHLLWKEWDRRTYNITWGRLLLNKPYWVDRGILYKDKDVYMKSIGLNERYGDKIKEWLGDYYLLPRLSALIENNFQTEDEIRHYETLKIAQDNLDEARLSVRTSKESVENAEISIKYAKYAIWVAILVGIISAVVNAWLARDKTVTIDKEQVNFHLSNQSEMINSIKSVGRSLKDTFVVHIDNQLDDLDTLNVRVTNAKKDITDKSVKKKE
ncbi:hypothetical protein [Fibrobacter sp.]